MDPASRCDRQTERAQGSADRESDQTRPIRRRRFALRAANELHALPLQDWIHHPLARAPSPPSRCHHCRDNVRSRIRSTNHSVQSPHRDCSAIPLKNGTLARSAMQLLVRRPHRQRCIRNRQARRARCLCPTQERSTVECESAHLHQHQEERKTHRVHAQRAPPTDACVRNRARATRSANTPWMGKSRRRHRSQPRRPAQLAHGSNRTRDGSLVDATANRQSCALS